MTLSRWARKARTLLLAAFTGTSLAAAALAANDDFLDQAQAFLGSAEVRDAKTVQVRIAISPNYPTCTASASASRSTAPRPVQARVHASARSMFRPARSSSTRPCRRTLKCCRAWC